MKILDRLGEHLYHARAVHRLHHDMMAIQDDYFHALDPDNADADPANAAVFARQLAARFESKAEHLAASWLARIVTGHVPRGQALAQASAFAAQWHARSDELFTEAARASR